MKKCIYIALALLIVGLVMITLSGKSPIKQDSPAALEKVVVAQAFEVFLYAPLYVAKDKGFFEKEGIDVEIVTAGGDDKAFAAVLSGDAMFAVGDPTFSAISAERGKPGIVIAGLLRGVPFMGVTNDPELVVNEPGDLAGLKIATFPAPSTAYTVQRQYLKNNHIEAEIIETSFGTLLSALDNGVIDIALELEPNVSLATRNGKRVVYSLAKEYPDFAITGVTTLPSTLESQTDTVTSFENALLASLQFIRENPTEAAKLMHARFPEVEEDVAQAAIENMIAQNVFPPDTTISKLGWEQAIAVRRSVGDLTIDAPYDNFVK